jgi:malate dehydrogenase (oxaloacetate-decarboxylating)
MPPLSAVQEVSQAVAEAVAIAAVQEGLARQASTIEAAIARLAACRWSPVYEDLEAEI